MPAGLVYELRLPSGKAIVLCDRAIYDELCDEKCFAKGANLDWSELRHAVHDGLFSIYKGNLIAHRSLVPAFGRSSVT